MLTRFLLVLGLVVGSAGQRSSAVTARAGNQRPMVGVVLSGGGARGGAHIGALRQLEQMGIPIDLVVGTSIGALVGGLYAVGYTTEDIERIVKSVNWNSLFDDKPDRRLLNIDNKSRMDRGLLELQFEGFNPSLPAGLKHGQRIHQLLDRLTAFQVFEANNDYDRLRIRFRAVATDLLTGKSHVFRKGSLSRALQASMAIPGVFKPVDFGDTLLVDGGLADNLPVDVARDCGADLVIAVDVSTPLRQTKSEIRTLFDVLDQAISIHIEEHKIRNMQLADLVITPDLGDFSSANFPGLADLIDVGTRAVEERSGDIRELLGRNAVRLERPAGRGHLLKTDGRGVRESSETSPQVRPDSIAFEGLGRTARIREVATGLRGPLTAEMLDRQLSLLYGTNHFEGVSYRLDRTQNQTILTYELKQSPPTRLGFGLRYDLDYDFVGSVEMATRGGPIPGSEWEFRGLVGNANGAMFRWRNVPLENRTFTLSPQVYYFSHPRNVFHGGDFSGSVDDERTGFLMGAGWLLGNRARLEGGYRLERVSGIQGPDWGPADSRVLAGLELEIRLDTLDQAYFPASGNRSSVGVQRRDASFGSDSSFSRFFAESEHFFELRPGTTLGLEGRWGKVNGDEVPYLERLFAGGNHSLDFSAVRFVGLERDRFAGLHHLVGGLSLRQKVKSMELGLLRGIYVGGRYQAGLFNEGDEVARFGDLLHGLGLGLYLDSAYLGPVSLEIAGTSERDFEFYLTLGHRF